MLRVGIIGAGRMGNRHASSVCKLGTAVVTAIYDINPQQSTALCEKIPGAVVMSSASELVQSDKVDMIIITSPTYCHVEGLRVALATGKPIFCEKPLCRSREDLAELSPLICGYSNMFAIGFVRRYSAGVIMMKKLLDSGKIGHLVCGSICCLFGGFKREWGDWFADYDKSGGVMLDMLAHHCDLQNYLIGAPESIYAKSLMLNKTTEKPYDYLSATASYCNGYFSNMECSWLRSGPSNTYMIVYGDKGALKLSDSEGLIFFPPGQPAENIPLDESIVTDIHSGNLAGDMYEREIAVVIDCATNHTKPYAVAQDAINAMNFCFGMMESAETGKIVRF